MDVWCDDDGSIAESHPLVNGTLHGAQRWWATNDRVYEETWFVSGARHGVARRWTTTGDLEDGYPTFYLADAEISRESYMEAVNRDESLRPYLVSDDSPVRKPPAAYHRLFPSEYPR